MWIVCRVDQIQVRTMYWDKLSNKTPSQGHLNFLYFFPSVFAVDGCWGFFLFPVVNSISRDFKG